MLEVKKGISETHRELTNDLRTKFPFSKRQVSIGGKSQRQRLFATLVRPSEGAAFSCILTRRCGGGDWTDRTLAIREISGPSLPADVSPMCGSERVLGLEFDFIVTSRRQIVLIRFIQTKVVIKYYDGEICYKSQIPSGQEECSTVDSFRKAQHSQKFPAA